MKLPLFSMDTFRNRLANLDALPQFAVLGVLSGVVTGLVILVFRQAIEIPLRYWLPDNNPENFEALEPLSRFLAPLLGTLLVGLIYTYLNKESRSVGVTHVLERLNYHEGHLSLKNAGVQFLAGVISIVSGQSAGREGPAIHLGAASNSFLGKLFQLPNNSIRVLVGCGAAAAISASFNTPMAGVIFAMEVIIMEYTIAGFTPVILASVSAAFITRLFYGAAPAFAVPALSSHSLWDIPVTILLGIIFGALSALFIKSVRYLGKLQHYSWLSRALFAGLACGALAVLVPGIMGVSYDSVNDALLGNIGITALCLIALAKFIATAIPVGLGLPVSLIGPVLVVGACAGAALGIAGNLLFPQHASEIGLYSMLGMGAMMGATLQAPLAALMALLELTGNPNIILPGMLSIVIANITTHSLFKEQSVFLTILATKDIRFNDTPVLQTLRRSGVTTLMNQQFITHDREISLGDAALLLQNSPDWIVINDQGAPSHALPAADLARFLDEQKPATHTEQQPEVELKPDAKIDLLEIPAHRLDLKSIHRQATLQEALDALHNSGFEALYVKRVRNPQIKLVAGIITRQDIENHYLHK